MSTGSNIGAEYTTKKILNIVNKQIKLLQTVNANTFTKLQVLKMLESIQEECNSIAKTAKAGWY
jgi:hypothetical protein